MKIKIVIFVFSFWLPLFPCLAFERTGIHSVSQLDDDLYWTSLAGDYQKVNALIRQGANVNFHSPGEGLTPLHLAVGLGDGKPISAAQMLISPRPEYVEERLKVVKLLIDKGANVNAKSEYGFTPLHFVGIKEIAELLIKRGANINAVDKSSATPLLHTGNIHKSVAEVLIKHGADINYQGAGGDTLLMIAVRSKNRELVKYLAENGADLNIKAERGQRALNDAFLARDDPMAEYLISKGAYITTNVDSSTGNSELHNAVNTNNLSFVKKILEGGDAVDLVNAEGDTALVLAVINNNKPIAELLIKYGADVNALCRRWNNVPLFFFVKNREMLTLLLNNNLNVNLTDNSGRNYHYYIGSWSNLKASDKKNLIDLIENYSKRGY